MKGAGVRRRRIVSAVETSCQGPRRGAETGRGEEEHAGAAEFHQVFCSLIGCTDQYWYFHRWPKDLCPDFTEVHMLLYVLALD